MQSSAMVLHEPIKEIIGYSIKRERFLRLSSVTWRNVWHVIVGVKCGGLIGWGESLVSVNENPKPLDKVLDWTRELIGQPLSRLDNLMVSPDKHHARGQREAVEMALLDVASQHLRENVSIFFGGYHRKSIPVLYMVSGESIDDILRGIDVVILQGAKWVKVKFHGDSKFDLDLIKRVRILVGSGIHLIADANAAYQDDNDGKMDELLVNFAHMGLDIFEDPAKFSPQRWSELSIRKDGLRLMIDMQLRPSTEGIRFISKAMPNAINIHPNCTGSILAASVLAKTAKALGISVMIGSNGQIGPGISIYHALAASVCDLACEEIGQDNNNDIFLSYCQVNSLKDGEILFSPTIGSGFKMNIDKLEREAKDKILFRSATTGIQKFFHNILNR